MMRIRTAAATAAIVAGAAFLVGGPYLAYRGFDAKAQVRDALVAEQIVTPKDASIPNARVDDAATAVAQAEVIDKHAKAITEGKTYAELDREDPRRAVAFQASALRTSLMASALAWNIANLLIGLGVLVGVLGLVLVLVGVAIRKPEQLVLTANAEFKEPVTV